MFVLWSSRSRGTETRFTSDASVNLNPFWSPRGDRIVFTSNRTGAYNLYQKAASGRLSGLAHQEFNGLQLRALISARPSLQGSPIDKFGDQVLTPFEFAGIVDRKDVWMVQ